MKKAKLTERSLKNSTPTTQIAGMHKRNTHRLTIFAFIARHRLKQRTFQAPAQ